MADNAPEQVDPAVMKRKFLSHVVLNVVSAVDQDGNPTPELMGKIIVQGLPNGHIRRETTGSIHFHGAFSGQLVEPEKAAPKGLPGWDCLESPAMNSLRPE